MTTTVDATVARVAQLQSIMFGAPAAQTVPASQTGSGDFQSQLQQAQGASASSASTGGAANVPGGPAGGSPTKYDGEINAAAARHGIPASLLKGLIRAESNFNPTAGSPAGAQGLAQLMPGTARGLGVTNVHDPVQSIEGGAKYLAQQMKTFDGDVKKALAAYNAGPGAVQRFGGIPPYAETQNYVKRVLGYAQEYGGATA